LIVRASSATEEFNNQLEKLRNEKIEIEQKLVARCRELSIDVQEDWSIGILEKTSFEALKSQLVTYEESMLRVSSQLHLLKSKLTNFEFVDVKDQEKKLESLELKCAELNHEYESEVSKDVHIRQSVELLTSNEKQFNKQTSAYKVINRMARTAKGDNPKKLSFERYVLAMYLEDVLYMANTRLALLTDKRFRLIRLEESDHKAKQAGLELAVFDAYTGLNRHVKTLSGGEAFKASLALALGLADVVERYAGGISLDTLLIDEGFGTLDAESLDQAINCLIALNEAGRMVGVISHVADLKERIMNKIIVTPSINGSTIRVEC
jgi:exonuclease SbcC